MANNQWYVLVRGVPSDPWTCVDNLSKETATVISAQFDEQSLDSVVGFGFPNFCQCPALAVNA